MEANSGSLAASRLQSRQEASNVTTAPQSRLEGPVLQRNLLEGTATRGRLRQSKQGNIVRQGCQFVKMRNEDESQEDE
mgnify:CR=1 FL=1